MPRPDALPPSRPEPKTELMTTDLADDKPYKTIDLPTAKVEIDGGTQARVKLDEEAVQEYADALAEGAELPPIEAVFDGASYWPWDGFHRYHAHRNAGAATIRCNVRRGTREDAQWRAIGANREPRAVRRTNADKANSVRMALGHPNGPGLSDGAIAEHCGTDRKTVAKYRAELEATREIPKSPKRTGRDGRTIATGGIGGKPPRPARPARPEPQWATVDPEEDAPFTDAEWDAAEAEQAAKNAAATPRAGPVTDLDPARLRAPFAGWRRRFSALLRELVSLASGRGGAHLTDNVRAGIRIHAKNLDGAVKAAESHAVGRLCGGVGGDCPRCRKSGYLTRLVAESTQAV